MLASPEKGEVFQLLSSAKKANVSLVKITAKADSGECVWNEGRISLPRQAGRGILMSQNSDPEELKS